MYVVNRGRVQSAEFISALSREPTVRRILLLNRPALAPFRVVMETRHRRAPEDSGIRAGRWSALAGCLFVFLVCLSVCLSVSVCADRLFVMNGRDSPGYRRLR